MNNANNLDRIIQDEMDRSEAAQTLKGIAQRFPDLFEKVARAFLGQRKLVDEVNEKMSEIRAQQKMSPTEAVLDWLKDNGPGTSSMISSDLADKIETKSDKPSTIIHSTLSSLERRGMVESFKNKNGGKTFALKK